MNNSSEKNLAIFEGKKIRRHYDEKTEMWYLSVVDIVGALEVSDDPRNYWKVLKNRLKAEGSEVVTKCNQLKMLAPDGKMRETDATSPEYLFRIIQSIPSPKAEPIKVWLAKVGYERVQQRMMGQEIRNKLTDYWKDNEVKGQGEYAILTNIIHEEWSDLSVREHKNLKDLKRENLRDHMTDAELVFTALAELSTRQIAETMETKGLEENKIPAKKGGTIAKNARLELEQKTGRKVISGNNYLERNEKKKLK
jgi:hypothetical protein